MCYMKQLIDPSRAFNIAPRVTKSCKEEPKLPSSSKWVANPGYQFQGPAMVTKGGVSSLESCEVACLSTVGCAAVSYTRYSQTCVLHSVANNYYPVWSKAVDLSAVAAVPYNYKVCYGNYDVPHTGDVNNFQGSFQDCAKCMANGNANAFAWYLGPTGAYAQPTNPLGTCYCKKINGDVPVPPPMPRNNGGTIFCQA
ncbi:hypothetical protein SPRG_12702 [Saprolegnia parasitica CBS 223.65]|uniref:Apple domain-containing protein n=1 Tax=Saprolegnia parasitica (strain CBS 223.65) TaxID=695850 RepID=A0A067C6I2_SAPPC|nr:hypothetical protein SPRG_12702 [Saprolegnia parasitica CBS 223.65]KDO22422.1 hypothetical protein SPRG_12702 [Saprolegnia parasitica CBS 223.65]|eukprot:XP_012206812.1 hypothetical protein SPRG_12702 [Saprolegnia parasitica CBS 223.65]